MSARRGNLDTVRVGERKALILEVLSHDGGGEANGVTRASWRDKEALSSVWLGCESGARVPVHVPV